MKTLRVNDKLIILDGRDPLKYIDLATKKLYDYPAFFDEASEWPIYKWWRNPVKWYQWRKLLKISSKNSKIILQSTPAQPNEFWRKSDLE